MRFQNSQRESIGYRSKNQGISGSCPPTAARRNCYLKFEISHRQIYEGILKTLLFDATLEAISQIGNPRYFYSERGYQGALYCCLRSILEQRGILMGDYMLEMEYQKTTRAHHINQRPDIILHIPREISGSRAKRE